MRKLVVTAVLTAAGLAGAAGTASVDLRPGVKTSRPAMLSGAAPGVRVRPILTVGERIGRNYVFDAIPDGISVLRRNKARFNLYVNHETSLVPFPANLSDMTNAMVSRLTLNRKTLGVLSGSYVVPSSANYQRFCSNFLATKVHGFSRPLLFTNEEATDLVNRTGQAWPPGSNAEQAGVVVAVDVLSGRYRAIHGMGRHNHENSVALPGFKRPVILSGDDTFSAPASQLYMYSAGSGTAVWNDRGTLYGFKADDPNVNDYGDITSGTRASGRFVPVPREVARGDQNALESWSNANRIFQFIRVEDIAYDRRSPNVVYFADTGEPRALPDPATGRLRRGPASAKGPYPNGRVFRMVLDRNDPLVVRSLSILVDGDRNGPTSAGDPSLIHNPDNLETTRTALLIQEDPGSQNRYAPTDANGTTARVWRLDLRGGALTVVARVDQSADPMAPLGDWESSGIVNAAAVAGRGWFFTNVQAHTIFVEQRVENGVTFKREGGQLLLIRIPGT
jgi:hypothetical protein